MASGAGASWPTEATIRRNDMPVSCKWALVNKMGACRIWEKDVNFFWAIVYIWARNWIIGLGQMGLDFRQK